MPIRGAAELRRNLAAENAAKPCPRCAERIYFTPTLLSGLDSDLGTRRYKLAIGSPYDGLHAGCAAHLLRRCATHFHERRGPRSDARRHEVSANHEQAILACRDGAAPNFN